MICNGVIERSEKNNNKIEYVVKYDKHNEFNKLIDSNIDDLFRNIVDDYLNQKEPILNIKNGYLESEINHLVIKTFFESFFEEFENSKNNIKSIASIFNDYKKLFQKKTT